MTRICLTTVADQARRNKPNLPSLFAWLVTANVVIAGVCVREKKVRFLNVDLAANETKTMTLAKMM